MFSCEIFKIFKNIYFEEQLRTTASNFFYKNIVYMNIETRIW